MKTERCLHTAKRRKGGILNGGMSIAYLFKVLRLYILTEDTYISLLKLPEWVFSASIQMVKINKTETKDYKTILTAKYVYQKNKSI